LERFQERRFQDSKRVDYALVDRKRAQMSKEPGYRRHKATGQAYVRLGGKCYYLGTYGTKDSKEAYNRLKSEWLVNRHAAKFSQSGIVTMAELALAYLDHADEYYRESNERIHAKRCLKPVSVLYSKLNVEDFGPVQFETVRNWWMTQSTGRKSDSGKIRTCSRRYCNSQMKRLLRCVKWGVAKGMVSVSVYQTLKCVDPLKRGRCDAPEMQAVRPVDISTIEKTVMHLTPVVADMVRVQLILGCRPGELCKITPSMIDRSSDVWEIRLVDHKTAYRGKLRTIYAGPKAQLILAKYLLRGADDPLFSPAESERQRLEAQHEARMTPMSCGNKPGSNVKANPRKKPGISFTTQSYSKAISNAATKAGVDRWSANQLRHTRATEIRSKYGLEAAAAILGHSEIGVTQIYAEADVQRALEVTRKTG